MKRNMFKNHCSQAMITIVVTGCLVAGVPVEAQEFSYNGDTGPGFWSELDPAWGTCSGDSYDARQSPIDIAWAWPDRRLRPLNLALYDTTIDIFNNGHTIEQSYEGTGSNISFRGRTYDLQQFHFHTLSEHTIRGSHGVMEMHGVFQDASDYVVVGVLFELGKHENAFIQTLIDAGLPVKNGDATQSGTPINFQAGLTNTRHYYSYSGSLTTPPCSETVDWVVLAQRAKMSPDQYSAFRDILGNNFRPLQATNGRVVRSSVPGWKPDH